MKTDLQPIPAYGLLFEAEMFFTLCINGKFTDKQGKGYYANNTHYDLIHPVYPSDVIRNVRIKRGYKFVYWEPKYEK
jgi:hypothetical protein